MSTRKSLEQQLLELPRDVVPPRNLWPGISQRLAASRRTRPMLMAACVATAAACIASLFTWAVLRRAEARREIGDGGEMVDVMAVSDF